jgi:hypothetical protein
MKRCPHLPLSLRTFKVHGRSSGAKSEKLSVFVGEKALDRSLAAIDSKKEFHTVGLI